VEGQGRQGDPRQIKECGKGGVQSAKKGDENQATVVGGALRRRIGAVGESIKNPKKAQGSIL